MIRKKNKFSLRKEYKKSWEFIKGSKKFIYLVIMIFFVFALIGFFVPVPDAISEQILKIIFDLIEKTKDMSNFELINFIFFNNLKSSFYGMFLRMFLGIAPVLFSLFNGYLLGFVALMAVNEQGFLSLWRIFPHGIFELPAVFISLGLGMKLGSFIFQRNKAESFKDFLWNSLRVFLLIVLPLLIIAAIIEGTLIALAG